VSRERQVKSGDAGRRELRLESDAEAVQIVTIHKSKGLEYGIVFCHCLWETKEDRASDGVLVHEDDGVVLDYGSDRQEERRRRAEAERAAEELRLAYVALTRAKWRCYVGWGVIKQAAHSALGWLLRPPAEIAEGMSCEELLDAGRNGMGAGAGWLERLQAFVTEHDGFMECHVLAEEPTGRPWPSPESAIAAPPVPRRFRAADQLVRLGTASFTSLIRGHESHVDERDVADPGSADGSAMPATGIFAFAKGRRTGDLLHAVFEHADFQAVAGERTRAEVERLVARDPRVVGDMGAPAAVEAILAMLHRVTSAPLPGADFALRDVPTSTTLREWPFVLPLAPVTGRTLASIFETHAGTASLRAYGRQLARLSRQEVQGYLTGVVDLAFTHGGRWYVVDWKSNHLGDACERYDAAAIEAEMTSHHYVLQYHLYVLALHRYLRARLPGYAYETHMGGTWYAFVRGVQGTSRYGWWDDRPGSDLVEALDRTLVQGAMQAEGER
jgi:exodeoxyribonuclease V beta subunit